MHPHTPPQAQKRSAPPNRSTATPPSFPWLRQEMTGNRSLKNLYHQLRHHGAELVRIDTAHIAPDTYPPITYPPDQDPVAVPTTMATMHMVRGKQETIHQITEAIQEPHILSTVVRGRGATRSFQAAYDATPPLRKYIRVNEHKWHKERAYQYKIATTFSPLFARAILDYFEPGRVLDPCAGWGDRLLGALAAPSVHTYCAFDPNSALMRPGYLEIADLARADGQQVEMYAHARPTSEEFQHTWEIAALPPPADPANCKRCCLLAAPFEHVRDHLPTTPLFDLVFTSPPFFEFEIYSPSNPVYQDWLEEFYRPLFVNAHKLLRPGKHMVIYLGDTSAGRVVEFMHQVLCVELHMIPCNPIGLVGAYSSLARCVYVFQSMPDLQSK